jgi:uncharacterized repeat protein (TIGR01451 family)
MATVRPIMLLGLLVLALAAVAYQPVAAQGTADLSITSIAQDSHVKRGQPIVYLVTVTNLGPDAAVDVRFGQWLGPDWLNPLSISCSAGSPASSSGCLVASLAPGASATATVVASHNLPCKQPGEPFVGREIEDAASVRAAGSLDPNLSNDRDFETVKVVGRLC